MKDKFYKQRKNKMFAGVLAGISDRYGWDLNLVRALYVIFSMFTNGIGFFLYIVLAIFLPYKEDIMKDRFGTGPRKRKDADVIDDDKDGWYW
ncbi:PspC domain-containing protein [Streptococcus loxodontisalivarius]|uniref:Phage shock protein PspC (Stress-responsive transcriptional regulator) n=1 Tax=Streptococcus loxodontisalivarius TaxID=1349415 RepID=A0ABS2PSV9_9STRE|nr:PspC domain-containing protein [Streptococcus loxodontisalivarius]MBM7643013.1 phage shock protein PspC (stress-responsive transcriptional regulator) [Streptococcus loxodontisalivarius]